MLCVYHKSLKKQDLNYGVLNHGGRCGACTEQREGSTPPRRQRRERGPLEKCLGDDGTSPSGGGFLTDHANPRRSTRLETARPRPTQPIGALSGCGGHTPICSRNSLLSATADPRGPVARWVVHPVAATDAKSCFSKISPKFADERNPIRLERRKNECDPA